MIRPLFSGFVMFLGTLTALCQVAPDKYLVEFTDKNNSPYSVDTPQVYLSQRAIDRRIRYNIPVTPQDFPVNPDYILAVRQTGAKFVEETKWLNAIIIKTTDTNVLNAIAALPFVRRVSKNHGSAPQWGKDTTDYSAYSRRLFTEPVNLLREPRVKNSFTTDYGEGFSQISQVGGTLLHDQGYRGQGMGIAVLDGGFTGTNLMTVFDSLRDQERLLGTLNLVGGGTYVYQGTPHGSSVLSIMAADSPGLLVGTAPEADYWLIRTEDVNEEYILEEYNWARGAEWADSAGADIISSSLAYKIFIDNATSHTYQQTDGNTAPITIAADCAMSKGMIVVTSAGNDGQQLVWPQVGFPADGDSVCTVGAVDAHGIYAPFSSTGPTVDGRLKPNCAARGVATIVAVPGNLLAEATGTSYSTPIVAGMTACLWQAFPEKTNMQILEAVRKSCSRANTPDTLVGYGVPDFSRALSILLGVPGPAGHEAETGIYPNPFAGSLTLKIPSEAGHTLEARITDIRGSILFSGEIALSASGTCDLSGQAALLLPGTYLLTVLSPDRVSTFKLLKQ